MHCVCVCVCVCTHVGVCSAYISNASLKLFFLFVCSFVCIFSITAPQVEKEW